MLATPTLCQDSGPDQVVPSSPDLFASAEVVMSLPEPVLTPEILSKSLSPEQHAAWRMQSMSSFAQTHLLAPAEDVWNHV